ncbi:hypothetical protein TNCV_3449301 [Trichonephila clavipes]|nr:hypothetical protein TNCV_3449301 [Trichonephila clavipes]
MCWPGQLSNTFCVTIDQQKTKTCSLVLSCGKVKFPHLEDNAQLPTLRSKKYNAGSSEDRRREQETCLPPSQSLMNAAASFRSATETIAEMMSTQFEKMNIFLSPIVTTYGCWRSVEISYGLRFRGQNDHSIFFPEIQLIAELSTGRHSAIACRL